MKFKHRYLWILLTLNLAITGQAFSEDNSCNIPTPVSVATVGPRFMGAVCWIFTDKKDAEDQAKNPDFNPEVSLKASAVLKIFTTETSWDNPIITFEILEGWVRITILNYAEFIANPNTNDANSKGIIRIKSLGLEEENRNEQPINIEISKEVKEVSNLDNSWSFCSWY